MFTLWKHRLCKTIQWMDMKIFSLDFRQCDCLFEITAIAHQCLFLLLPFVTYSFFVSFSPFLSLSLCLFPLIFFCSSTETKIKYSSTTRMAIAKEWKRKTLPIILPLSSFSWFWSRMLNEKKKHTRNPHQWKPLFQNNFLYGALCFSSTVQSS